MKKRTKKYIPFRFIVATLITVFLIFAIIGIVVYLCYKVPRFYTLALVVQFLCVVHLIASDDNPDYKVPWLVLIMGLPIVGFMLYFLFFSRKLSKRYVRKLKAILNDTYERDDQKDFNQLKNESVTAYNQFKMLSKLSGASLFTSTKTSYFGDINELTKMLLNDIKNAKNFIFIEFFIVEQGEFWNSILKILIEKAKCGVDVRVLYDDIGCIRTLPGNYYKKLQKFSIKAIPFSRMRGGLDSEFNNRNHRKIVAIDGKIGYTGGFNLADEYVNKKVRFGKWKDSGIRLEGKAVFELVKLFLIDFGLNDKENIEVPDNAFSESGSNKFYGYVMPFGDGPKPLYQRSVSKAVIQSLLASAKNYVYISTPYLIVDNDLLSDIENASLRGVEVKIAIPGIPDKKIVYEITKSCYSRLLSAGVKIYEYTPGFVHAKNYLVDGEYALSGSINLDYRSLVHHFENGVLVYKTESVKDIENDLNTLFSQCKQVHIETIKNGPVKRLFISLIKFFAPLM